ncbi:MAG: CDP-diacylglycerol--serine O-phosphatidyltransferase [Bacteroidia bacterium]
MKFIPHLFTSGNLFSGILAIVFIGQGDFIAATYCIFIASLLDFLDGFAARLLKVTGEFGKQLDSLADVVTFGVVPGFMLFQISKQLAGWPFNQEASPLFIYLPLLIGVFSALRLAKFNIDTRQSNSFLGLPVPANALWICAVPYCIRDLDPGLESGLIHPYSIALLTLVSCFLLVSEIPLLSLKVKSLSMRENWAKYLLLLSMGLGLLFFQFAGLLILVPVYLIFSVIDNQVNKNKISA